MTKEIEALGFDPLTEKETVQALAIGIDRLNPPEKEYTSSNFKLTIRKTDDHNKTVFLDLYDTARKREIGTLVVKDAWCNAGQKDRITVIVLPNDNPRPVDAQHSRIKSTLRRFMMAIVYRDFYAAHKAVTEDCSSKDLVNFL